jgi:hypothetical protein
MTLHAYYVVSRCMRIAARAYVFIRNFSVLSLFDHVHYSSHVIFL